MKPVRDLVYWYLKKKQLAAVPAGQLPTFAAGLERLLKRNVKLGSVIDVGASDGRWSAQLLPYQPKARYLCIEALSAHEPALRNFVATNCQVDYVICAAGDRQGQIHFRESGLLGGWVSESARSANCVLVPVNTIDALAEARSMPPPFLIKLDTHGYELPILAGAARTLQQTEVLIVEVYNFPGSAPAVSFYEFCRLMAEKGFRCIDLFDPLYRPHDDALWQMDLVFLRESRPEFQYNGFD
jgi:FkbM family methyltransferase